MSLPARNALIALFITLAIVGTIAYAFNYLNQERVKELQTIEDELSTDTLSVDTQFALLESASCKDLAEGNVVPSALSDIGDRLAFTEEKLGADNAEVVRLKERYTLLQIRDYLLSQKVAETCGVKPTLALYFYSNIPGECTTCDRAGYALSYMRQTYPTLRVYSFDYHLDLAALKTLIAVTKVTPQFPAFIIQGKTSYGFTSLEDLEKLFPKALFKTASTTTATSTKAN